MFSQHVNVCGNQQERIFPARSIGTPIGTPLPDGPCLEQTNPSVTTHARATVTDTNKTLELVKVPELALVLVLTLLLVQVDQCYWYTLSTVTGTDCPLLQTPPTDPNGGKETNRWLLSMLHSTLSMETIHFP